eukprot:8917956-Pyramimonas_sp.AAC.1
MSKNVNTSFWATVIIKYQKIANIITQPSLNIMNYVSSQPNPSKRLRTPPLRWKDNAPGARK